MDYGFTRPKLFQKASHSILSVMQDHYPIIYEIEDIDLSNLKMEHIDNLYPISSLDDLKSKVKRNELEIFVNNEITGEELEKLTPLSERITYTILGRIPILVAIGITVLGFFFNYYFFLLLLTFPISYYLAPLTFSIRYLLYTVLLIISAILIYYGNSWTINLCITQFLLLMIWRQNISTQLIRSVIRQSLKSEAAFLKNFLSNRVLLVNNEKIFNRTEDILKIIEEYVQEHPKELSIDVKLYFCKRCDNKGFDKYEGVVCGLTNRKPSFLSDCSNYSFNQGFAYREDVKEAKRISWYSEAISSTKLSLVLLDIMILGLVLSAVRVVLIGESILFMRSGLSLYLIDQKDNIDPIIDFALPGLLFLLSIVSRLKNPFAIILGAILIGVDALPLAFLGDYTLEPHIHIAIAFAIGSGYLNINNAKIYENALSTSNAYLKDYFLQQKISKKEGNKKKAKAPN